MRGERVKKKMKQVLVLVVVASLVLAVAAKNLDFALEYRGQCSYANNSGFCRLKAQSQEILTKIKADGKVETSINRLIGSLSHLDFTDIYNATSHTFTSRGTLSFGIHRTEKDHMVEFENQGMGRLNNTPHPDREYAFVTVWKVTKGYGALANAIGTITANGVYNFEKDEAIVGVVGVIWYKDDQAVIDTADN